MKSVIRAISIPIVSLVLCATASAPGGTGGTFFASLSGQQEVPPVETRARGEAILHLSEDSSELGFQRSLADLIEKIRARNAHVNVHTIDHPSGEIRGQIRVAGSRMRDRR